MLASLLFWKWILLFALSVSEPDIGCEELLFWCEPLFILMTVLIWCWLDWIGGAYGFDFYGESAGLELLDYWIYC